MKGSTRSLIKSQIGVGLIEVLIALLVTSVGVLGMAGLQTKSLQHNQNSYFRAQAVVLANDMMDRIRANRTLAASTADYEVSETEHTADDCSEESFINRCEAAACNETELALYDLQQWKFQLACQLPEAQGSIAIEDSAEGRVYLITLKFDESRGATAIREVTLRGGL